MKAIDKDQGLTIERVREFFNYDPNEGILKWKVKRKKANPSQRAGSVLRDGYLRVTIDNKSYQVHRVIWFLMTGSWPKELIDHADLDKQNNVWNNLREATTSQNAMNKRAGNNKIGHRCIRKNLRGKGFSVALMIDRKTIGLGTFSTLPKAIEARDSAIKMYHREFARVNI